MLLLIRLFIFLFLIVCGVLSAAQVIEQDHVRIHLLAETNELKPNMTVGVHFNIDPEWHIYWKNSGDSGAAPKFNLSSGQVQSVNWPFPKRIPTSQLINFGYEDQVVLFLHLTNVTKESVLNLEWLVCKVDCIPGFGELKITPANLNVNPQLWEQFSSQIPMHSNRWSTTFLNQDPSRFTFKINSPESIPLRHYRNIYLFPEDGVRFKTQAPQIHTVDNGFKIIMNKASASSNTNEMAKFTLITETQDKNFESFNINVEPKHKITDWFIGLILALLGGMILNLMPCVFPVLFLKAYGFLKTDSPTAIKKSAWLYSAGVILSFAIIGGVLLTLRIAGHSLGWGFQMQSPGVIIALIVLFAAMMLSFLDIINLNNLRLPKIFTPLMSSDFGTGVLAVIVASPCTAPFMGTALGLTLILPPLQSLFIFVAIGVGLAAPIPLLAHWPKLISKLPRSGVWMNNVKKAMAIPLLLTCIWLAWVLSLQLGAKEDSRLWNAYQPQQMEQIKSQHSVFIDFTAAWCITCQVNKKAVLETKEIINLFKENNVYLIRADWTNYDESITKALENYDRNSVPLYVFYDRINNKEILLPEVLTKNDIHKLFKKGESK